MIILEVPKPREKTKSHLKALVYAHLVNKGFDVFIDVTVNSLVKYTNGLKGYQKVRFDIVVYVGVKPVLVVMVSPNNRRFTKSSLFGIPRVVIDHKKYNLPEIYKEINRTLLGDIKS